MLSVPYPGLKWTGAQMDRALKRFGANGSGAHMNRVGLVAVNRSARFSSFPPRLSPGTMITIHYVRSY